MKIGIDSYCFHRYFGEIYPDLQADPGTRWRMESEFLDWALEQGIDEVALESCFFHAMDDGLCAEIRARLDEAGVDRVLGWGHPEGLWGGTRPEELDALIAHLPQVRKLGSTRMRICAASMNYASTPREQLLGAVAPLLSRAAAAAEAEGVTLALENHIDFRSQDVVELLERVDSTALKVNFDTGNTIRLFEDPVAAATALAPYTVSTHTKDIATRVRGGAPSENFTWWPSCPIGEGVIDMPGVVAALRDGGFDGCLAVEVDLIGERWADWTEEEIVGASVARLREIAASAAVPETA